MNISTVKKMLKTSLIILGLCSAFGASAASKVGVITQVLTYTDSDLILVKLDKMPEHHSCKTDYFAIDPAIPAARRQQVLSRLLTAFATGKKTNLVYHGDGNCIRGFMQLYRAG